MNRAIPIAVLVGIAGAGAYVVLRARDATELPRHQNAETVARGHELYDVHCAACHGSDLAGQEDWQSRDADGFLPAPPHDATGHTWHHPTEQLFAITKLGTEAIVGGGYRSNMAGFGDVLSDDEIYAVLAFIKSTWPDRIITRHSQMDAQFEEASRP